MKNLLNPKWLFVVNTFPVILLFTIAFGQYDVIESLLSIPARIMWQQFAIVLLILSAVNVTYAIYSLYKKRNISIFYSLLSLVSYIIYLYIYVNKSGELIPFSVPQWMITSDVVFYPGTFLMPTLIHALLAIVAISIPRGKKPNAWLNFLYGLCFPLITYLFVQIALPLWQMPESKYNYHVFVVLFITLTVLFLFFISRGVFILINSHSSALAKHNLLWKIIIAIILPFTGLLVNNGVLFGKNSFAGSSPFGNFSDITFYALALINGITLCMPKFENETYRLARFLVLLVCFPYVLYFFFIFLPFLPLSIVAIIFVGVGFLMLAPLLIFMVQASDLHTEYSFFSKKYHTKKMNLSITVCLLLIPIIITLSYLRDKHILNEALSYVYDNDYLIEKKIDKKSLANTLAVIKQHKGRSRSSTSDEYLPFLTSFYNWLVLDNMILSDAKIATLEQIFYGQNSNLNPIINRGTKTAKINSLSVDSKYDMKRKYWKSTLELTLQNDSSSRFGIYETNFSLPEGCWVSDYYLYVGNKKEMGILAEKKSALWIFNQIRNVNQDPGLLYYLNGNRIAFKVFPFNKKEIRKTGITFIHKEPFIFNIDTHKVALGNHLLPVEQGIYTTKNAVYIPSYEKVKLPLQKRKPIYHFIIDVSKNNKHLVNSYSNRIENYLTKNRIDGKDVKINFTNSYTTSFDFTTDWTTKLKDQNFDGGYYLGRAIRQTLLKSYNNKSSTYPIMITITNQIRNAVILKDFADIQAAFPENSSFFELDKNGKIWEHSLITNPLQTLAEVKQIPADVSVFAWPNANKPMAYLANNNSPSIILKSSTIKAREVAKKTWEAGLNMQASWLALNLTPKADDKGHLALVKESMQQQIMSPVTSFIVVENEAQKKALRRKQEQILKGNKNLDTDEDTQSMSEPNLYLLLGLIALGTAIKHRKRYLV